MINVMYELENRKIIIYGAGMVGNLVRQYYEIKGWTDNIVAFAVSRCVVENEFYGYPLACIDDLKQYTTECTVLIATFPNQQESIVAQLRQSGFYKVIKMNFEVYQMMTKTYISNFLKMKKYNLSYDILYMASDNNRTSGAFLCLVDLVKDMNGKGLKTLVALPEYGDGEELLISEEIDYTYIPSKTWLCRIDGKKLTWQERNEEDNHQSIKAIETLIERYGIKLVHCNTTYTHIGALAAKNKGIFVVWHLREKISEQGYGYKNEADFYNLINASNQIITVSNYLKSNYSKLDLQKTITVYDGIDVEKYYVKKDIFDKKVTNILVPAVVYPLKRQGDLLKAVEILKKRKRQIHIKFVGAVGDEKYFLDLQKFVDEKNLSSCVSFVEKKANIIDYYRKSDMVVSCSGVESFGRILVEGMLAGCLVIGANSGGTAELIRHKKTGLLFDYKNSFSLAEMIAYAMDYPDEMRKIALNGQKNARQQFSKEKHSDQIYEIYNML